MNISGLPIGNICDKEGRLTDEWYKFFSNLVSQMQANLSDEGYIIPNQINDNILRLNSSGKSKQRFLYNSTISTMMVNNTGSYVAISTTMLMTAEQIAETDLSHYTGILVDTTHDHIYFVKNGIKKRINILED
jgi:hypothetical protein